MLMTVYQESDVTPTIVVYNPETDIAETDFAIKCLLSCIRSHVVISNHQFTFLMDHLLQPF